MITKNSEVIYLPILIGALETLEVKYDGMVSKEIIDLIKQAKDQAQMELRNFNLDEYTELCLSYLKGYINDDFTNKQKRVIQNKQKRVNQNIKNINKWLDSEHKEPSSDEDSVQ